MFRGWYLLLQRYIKSKWWEQTKTFSNVLNICQKDEICWMLIVQFCWEARLHDHTFVHGHLHTDFWWSFEKIYDRVDMTEVNVNTILLRVFSPMFFYKHKWVFSCSVHGEMNLQRSKFTHQGLCKICFKWWIFLTANTRSRIHTEYSAAKIIQLNSFLGLPLCKF